jgi:hypothetical protein
MTTYGQSTGTTRQSSSMFGAVPSVPAMIGGSSVAPPPPMGGASWGAQPPSDTLSPGNSGYGNGLERRRSSSSSYPSTQQAFTGSTTNQRLAAPSSFSQSFSPASAGTGVAPIPYMPPGSQPPPSGFQGGASAPNYPPPISTAPPVSQPPMKPPTGPMGYQGGMATSHPGASLTNGINHGVLNQHPTPLKPDEPSKLFVSILYEWPIAVS